MDFKDALSPFGGPQLATPDADADSAAAGQLGHCDSHECERRSNSGSGRADAASDLQQKPWQKTTDNEQREKAWDTEM